MARRSVLFSPGDRPEMLRKAPDAGADVVVFDLEDAVLPDRKAAARDHVAAALADVGTADAEICVRVNPVGRGAAADLDAVLGADAVAALDAVVLPKAESGDDVAALGRLLDERSLSVPVLALVETARGVLRAESVADADPTDALLYGAEDLAADVGSARSGDAAVRYAREHVLLAARAAGVDAIDAVFTDVADADGLRSAAADAAALGYDGKMVIHPAQVTPVHEAFAPSDSDVAWARRVLAARDEADAAGRGVFTVDGEMVDAPVVARAERLLSRAGERD